jgi:hypothetical protein
MYKLTKHFEGFIWTFPYRISFVVSCFVHLPDNATEPKAPKVQSLYIQSSFLNLIL